MHRPYRAALAALLLFAPILVVAQTGRRAKPPASPTPPQPYNRFVTVNEFAKAKRPSGTNVSVEGYVVVAVKSPGNMARLSLVDSTDNVLSARDANITAAQGAVCLAPIGGRNRPNWVLTRKGLLRVAMYTGAKNAKQSIQDTPPKVRLQGKVAKGRATLNPVTKIEYHDQNGDWRELK